MADTETTEAQEKALAGIIADAAHHGIEIHRDEMMIRLDGPFGHFSWVGDSNGMYAYIDKYGRYDGPLLYAIDEICNPAIGEACSNCADDPEEATP